MMEQAIRAATSGGTVLIAVPDEATAERLRERYAEPLALLEGRIQFQPTGKPAPVSDGWFYEAYLEGGTDDA